MYFIIKYRDRILKCYNVIYNRDKYLWPTFRNYFGHRDILFLMTLVTNTGEHSVIYYLLKLNKHWHGRMEWEKRVKHREKCKIVKPEMPSLFTLILIPHNVALYRKKHQHLMRVQVFPDYPDWFLELFSTFILFATILVDLPI